jgi:hypothetical protein
LNDTIPRSANRDFPTGLGAGKVVDYNSGRLAILSIGRNAGRLIFLAHGTVPARPWLSPSAGVRTWKAM